MKPILISMSIMMFAAVILPSYFRVNFETAAMVLCSLGSLGVVILGVCSLCAPAKEGGKKSGMGD